MRRAIRSAFVAFVAFVAVVGCDSNKKSEGTPNPDLQVPNVPPGRGAGGGADLKDMGGKKP
jgi:hypothetical protein